MEYAFEAVPSKLPFLRGLSQVCTRLPARQADLLLTHIDHSLTGHSPQEADPEWEDYWDFLALAQERASKGTQPRSALKGRPAKQLCALSKAAVAFCYGNTDGVVSMPGCCCCIQKSCSAVGLMRGGCSRLRDNILGCT